MVRRQLAGTSNLTVNFGVRWDADPSWPRRRTSSTSKILINNGLPRQYGSSSRGTGDFGYKTGIRDWKDVAPRVGFAYNVGGKNDLVIRGGSGIYFACRCRT